MLRTIGILGICGLAMSIGSGSARAGDDAEKMLKVIMAKLESMDDRISKLEGRHRTSTIIVPSIAEKPFPDAFKDVLQRQWKKHQEREEAKKVACFLKGLLDEYGDCCDPCYKPKTKTSSFLHPACYTTYSSSIVEPYYTSIVEPCYTRTIVEDPCYVSPRTFLIPACYRD